jgi:hypothetical protein
MSYYLCVFLAVWCLPSCLKSSQYDVCMSVLYVPSSMISAQLYDVCLLVWCMLNGVMSARLYDVCSTIWCLLSCIIASYPYDVCLTVSCMRTCLIFAQLYDVSLPVWCLLYPHCMMSAWYQIHQSDIRRQSSVRHRNDPILDRKAHYRISVIKSPIPNAHLCAFVLFFRNIW